MQEGQKTFEEVMARERTLLDDILDYLSKIDIKTLGKLTTKQIQDHFNIAYTDLLGILKVSPNDFIENFIADWALTHIALHKEYREMRIDQLAAAFGFSSTEYLKVLFREYNAFNPEIYCQIFVNMDKMVEEGKIGNV